MGNRGSAREHQRHASIYARGKKCISKLRTQLLFVFGNLSKSFILALKLFIYLFKSQSHSPLLCTLSIGSLSSASIWQLDSVNVLLILTSVLQSYPSLHISVVFVYLFYFSSFVYLFGMLCFRGSGREKRITAQTARSQTSDVAAGEVLSVCCARV